ncbi:MAG: HPr family phosphocarrier protein [Lentisphaeria bacterium]|nr:HPr family phosphocarrier protein [Lentisphaeria bacterium]
MITKETKIVNAYGIHCRPSAVILDEVSKFEDNSISISTPNGDCDLSSIIALLALGLKEHDLISINVDGPDAEKVADEMVELFQRDFDFKR